MRRQFSHFEKEDSFCGEQGSPNSGCAKKSILRLRFEYSLNLPRASFLTWARTTTRSQQSLVPRLAPSMERVRFLRNGEIICSAGSVMMTTGGSHPCWKPLVTNGFKRESDKLRESVPSKNALPNSAQILGGSCGTTNSMKSNPNLALPPGAPLLKALLIHSWLIHRCLVSGSREPWIA